MSLSSLRSVHLESDVELSEPDKCRSSHSVDSVGVFVERTIFNSCSGVSGWNLLSSVMVF